MQAALINQTFRFTFYPAQVFSSEICKIFRNTFENTNNSVEHLPSHKVLFVNNRVQRPEFKVQGPASRAQRPESSVQLLRPESRNSGYAKLKSLNENISYPPDKLYYWNGFLKKLSISNSILITARSLKLSK